MTFDEFLKAQPADEVLAEIEALRRALELIAAPMRPDGTWNRDRGACQQIAAAALAARPEGEKG